MKTSLVRAALTVCLLGSASIVAGALPTAALGAEKPAKEYVSKPVAAFLGATIKLIGANDYVTAKATLAQAQALPDRTALDDFEINNIAGTIALHLNDKLSADAAFEANAVSPAITEEKRAATLRIATLLATEFHHFDNGIKFGTAFVALGGSPDDTVLTAIADCYYFKNDFANAETFAMQAVAATPAGKIPNQSAYQVVFSSQLKQKKEAAALTTLETMAGYFNDPADWGQLIDTSLTAKGMKPIELLFFYRLRLATRASASGDEYSEMADLPLSIGYPGEAQGILELALATGKLSNGGKIAGKLADARSRAAKDRAALASFDAMAAKSPSNELDVKLAEDYYGYGRYADAEAAARRGIGKGASNEGSMVLGMALVLQGKNADAVAAFNNVKGGSPSMMKAQHLWSLYAGRKAATTTQ